MQKHKPLPPSAAERHFLAIGARIAALSDHAISFDRKQTLRLKVATKKRMVADFYFPAFRLCVTVGESELPPAWVGRAASSGSEVQFLHLSRQRMARWPLAVMREVLQCVQARAVPSSSAAAACAHMLAVLPGCRAYFREDGKRLFLVILDATGKEW